MNRRSFLSQILKAAVAPMMLPAAVTYARAWKAVGGVWRPDVNPEWVTAEYEVEFMFDPQVWNKPWPHGMGSVFQIHGWNPVREALWPRWRFNPANGEMVQA